MKKNLLYSVCLLVVSSLRAESLPVSSFGKSVRSEWVALVSERVAAAKENVAHHQRDTGLKEWALNGALKANANSPGVYPARIIEKLRLEVNLSRENIRVSEAKVQEASDLAELVQEAVDLGIDLPLRLEWRP